MKKIIVSGEGGQGVRVISITLAQLLKNLGYEVTLLYDYDAAVRGGLSLAHLVYGKEKIDNPVIDEADILLKLSDKAEELRAKTTVYQTGISDVKGKALKFEDIPPTNEEIPFSELGTEIFGKELFGYMIALGRLMVLADIKVSESEIIAVLPKKYKEENLSAINFGQRLHEEEQKRLGEEKSGRRITLSDKGKKKKAS
jgi:Pyruvate/2-oxoacid:ferredoxin oxidoreductase gamma subunit